MYIEARAQRRPTMRACGEELTRDRDQKAEVLAVPAKKKRRQAYAVWENEFPEGKLEHDKSSTVRHG